MASRTRPRPVVLPPFRELDPALAQAERLLADGPVDGLAAAVAALPDEDAAADRLNQALAHSGAEPRLPRMARRGVWW